MGCGTAAETSWSNMTAATASGTLPMWQALRWCLKPFLISLREVPPGRGMAGYVSVSKYEL